MTGTSGALFAAVFLACVVEAVEAVTIVLAAGTARSWKSAGYGVGAGLIVLAVITAALGPAVTAVPLGALRLIVGAVLLVFGLQWLRKAVLRASGHKDLHAFGAFWYDFVVGDDWRVAVTVVAALAVTFAVSKTSVAAWWIMPAAVALILPASLWRAGKR
jgi:uncharacterized membrane protein